MSMSARAVQGDVAVRTAPDDEFALVVGDWAADARIVLQHVERLDDFPDASFRMFHPMLGKVVEDALEILSNLRRQFDGRHRQRASFRATGRLAVLPATRASR